VSEKDSADQIKILAGIRPKPGGDQFGQPACRLISALTYDMPLIYGAGALNDNNTPGVSLASQPRKTVRRLKQIKPDIERVFVVYKPPATGWLISAGKRQHATTDWS